MLSKIWVLLTQMWVVLYQGIGCVHQDMACPSQDMGLAHQDTGCGFQEAVLIKIWLVRAYLDMACVPAVWGVSGASFILGLPLLSGVTAFAATTSIACTGLALTYGLPILLRVLNRNSYLETGPFTLGRCDVLWI